MEVDQAAPKTILASSSFALLTESSVDTFGQPDAFREELLGSQEESFQEEVKSRAR